MNGKPELKIDWATWRAAMYACKNWHYSGAIPTPPYNIVGVWEDDVFCGVVIFSRGASKDLGTRYGLITTEVCELSRVALRSHKTEVSKIVSIAIKMLRAQSPGIRLIVSFADTNHGHIGAIYQAGGWIYTGETSSSTEYLTKSGKVLHSRQVGLSGLKKQYGVIRQVPKQTDCIKIKRLPKHRYLMPLDSEMRKQIEPLRKQYPKKCVKSIDGDAIVTPDNRGQFDSDLNAQCSIGLIHAT